MSLRIGIDVGGTNTDAVLMDGLTVVSKIKTPTTADVTTGITTRFATRLANVRDGDVRDRRRHDRHDALHQCRRRAPPVGTDRRGETGTAGDAGVAADGRLAG